MMDITEDNFLIFAMKSYNSPNCIMAEFESDLKRIKYIKRLIRKYRTSGEIKERLLLNHIIVLANVFGVEASVRIQKKRQTERQRKRKIERQRKMKRQTQRQRKREKHRDREKEREI